MTRLSTHARGSEHMTLNEKLTLSISTFALAIAVATFGYTVVQDRQEKTEQLSLSVTERRSEYPVEIMPGFGSLTPALIALDWSALIANNGSTPVSVVEYELYGTRPNGNRFTYSRLNLGLRDADGTELELPILLDPGHAVRVNVTTGVMVIDSVYRALMTRFRVGDRPWYDEVWRTLARQGIDIWGNRVKFQEWGESDFAFEGPAPAEQRKIQFVLVLRTARGQEIVSEFGPYGSGRRTGS
jgi:hypothetical protein